MKTVSTILAILAALLLGAHTLRTGAVLLAVAIALLPLLLLVRGPWGARVLQAALAVGTLEWIRTATVLVDVRRTSGLPFTRLVVILAGVAVVTALASALLSSRSFPRPQVPA